MRSLASLLHPRQLALDPGSEFLSYYFDTLQGVTSEPAYVSLSGSGGASHAVAIGQRSKDIRGRTSDSIVHIRPFEDSKVRHHEAALVLLKRLLKGAARQLQLFRPETFVVMPDDLGIEDCNAVYSVLEAAGSGSVHRVSRPAATLLGLGVPLSICKTWVVVDCGATATRVSLVDAEGRTIASTIASGSRDLTRNIQARVQEVREISISESSAERLKEILGNTLFESVGGPRSIEGLHLPTGRVMRDSIGHRVVIDVCREHALELVRTLREFLDHCKPEVRDDLRRFGLILCGRGSLLKNLDLFVSGSLKLPVVSPEELGTASVLGAAAVIREPKRYEHLLRGKVTPN